MSFSLFDIEPDMLRAVIDETPAPTALYTGKNMLIKVANKAMLQIWLKDDDILDTPFCDALPEIACQRLGSLLIDAYQNNQHIELKEERVDRVVNGKAIASYYNITFKPLTDSNHSIWGILHTAIDITEQVTARFQLTEAQQRLQLAIESAGLGTWSIDATSMKIYPSARTKQFFGLQPDDELLFDEAMARIGEQQRPQVVAAITKAFAQGGGCDMEYPITDPKTGKQYWVHSTGRLYYDAHGNPANYSGIMIDITQRKQEEIRKNDFIAMVSHELKTPLTSIKSYIQISMGKAQKLGEPFIAGALAKADLQIVKMTKMIRGFLDLSKLESGKITLSPEVFDISELINEVVADARFINSSHFIEVDRNDAAPVNADRNKIAQVLDNFLSNAAKYSPRETEIYVNCVVNETDAVISVTDKGIGVKKQDQEKLFDRFYRADNEIMKTVAGFGIGLYIAGEIIHLHKGKIWVESEEFEGATFYFSLPLSV
ncbi:PAS domain S-box protein [Mucilaginibacter sp. UR6-1]|uniref:sensor histidine kinase n=1 Tax=Mucilaginibacter sp. UR6-1 TaxID=1435643 RepID=UPI001E3FF7E6|nr:ATP-binding protein [Mucilaginibacter sp. UR6-1]MCC8407421.1 PAS domain S-box protein [Mucilaginibacter sp. UR6-1]